MTIDKRMESKGTLNESQYLKQLADQVRKMDMKVGKVKVASEPAADEKDISDYMELQYYEALKNFQKNNPGATEDDFKESLRRLSLDSGGKVIDFSKYKKDDDWYKSKVRKLDLGSIFGPDRTLASLSDSEKEVVQKLLRMTLGKE